MTELTLPAGRIEVTEDGSPDGPAVVLVHGFMVDERIWAPIVPALAAAGLRVIRPTLPIGSQRIPLGSVPTPRGVAHLVADLIAALELEDVTLVGNDSGGAMSQMLLAERPERIGRMLLTNCDTADNFPPFPFDVLFLRLARYPRALHAALRLSARTGGTRMLFGLLTARGFDPALVDTWAGRYLEDPAVRAETDGFLRALDPRELAEAEGRLVGSEVPIRLLWGSADRFFTVDHARGLVHRLGRGEVVEVPGARTFVMHDAPERVAAEIIAFVEAASAAEERDGPYLTS